MSRRATASAASILLLAATAAPAADMPRTSAYASAHADWRASRFDQAYASFLQIRSSRTAGAISLDTNYYLLTAGCRHSRADIARDTQARLKILAADKRGESENGAAWRDALQREALRCARRQRPGDPPADIVLTSGVSRRPSYPPPGTHNIYKSPSGEPLQSGMASHATSPVRDPPDSLPKAVLDLTRDDPVAARDHLAAHFGSRVAVGERVVLIRASNSAQDYDLAAVLPQVNRFTQQLGRDLGLPAPDGYLFVVIYPDINSQPPEFIPTFPVGDRVLGLADTRTQTAYVVAKGALKGTVFHELTHLYIDAALGPEAPEWLSEGLASLYEQTVVVNGQVVGDRNYRGSWLKCRPTLVPSAEAIIHRGWYLDGELMGEVTDYPGVTTATGDRAGVANAAERYFARYLQQEGLLAHTVRYYASLSDTPTGGWPLDTAQGRVATLEAATGRSMAALNAGFAAWWPKDVQVGTGPLPESVGAAFRAPAGC